MLIVLLANGKQKRRNGEQLSFKVRKSKRGMVWEVKVGDSSGATSSKVSSLAARLQKGEKPKIPVEEAQKQVGNIPKQPIGGLN